MCLIISVNKSEGNGGRTGSQRTLFRFFENLSLHPRTDTTRLVDWSNRRDVSVCALTLTKNQMPSASTFRQFEVRERGGVDGDTTSSEDPSPTVHTRSEDNRKAFWLQLIHVPTSVVVSGRSPAHYDHGTGWIRPHDGGRRFRRCCCCCRGIVVAPSGGGAVIEERTLQRRL
jgi:hypothetical protein